MMKNDKNNDVVSKGRKMAEEHLKKYPDINIELQNELAEEFKCLQNLRPPWPD